MTSVERAARRIAEYVDAFPYLAESNIQSVAAIISEETGTRLSAEFDIYEAKDTGEMWLTVTTSLGTAAFGAPKGSVRGDVLKSALPPASEEGGSHGD